MPCKHAQPLRRLSMKILYVIGSMEVGGAEQHLLRVASALRQQGFSPEVFVLSPGGPLTSAFEKNGIPVHGVCLPRWFTSLVRHPRAIAWTGLAQATLALWWLLWRRRAPIVHFFLPAAYIVGGVAALLGPRSLRVMSRRSLNHYQAKHRLFRRIELGLHPHMDRVCGNSQAVVNDLISEGIAPERIRLIYNGIELDRFHHARPREATRAALGIASSTCLFVMVANLIPYKGHFDLIEALARVADRLPPDWACLCVGRDDGIGASLRQKAQDLGIASHLHFLGSRSDVADLLCAADVGVLCSHEEGFSNAVLEGMAAALPMVVTAVGGNAEAVLHGETGLVVPARDPAALGDALLQVSQDPARQAIGARGHERVAQVFSMQACIRGYQDLYALQTRVKICAEKESVR